MKLDEGYMSIQHVLLHLLLHVLEIFHEKMLKIHLFNDFWFNFFVARECNIYTSTQKHTPHRLFIFSLYNVEHIYIYSHTYTLYVRWVLLYGLMYSILINVSCAWEEIYLSICLSVFIKSSLVVQNIHIFIDFFLLELSIIEKGVFHSYIIMMIINFSLEFLNVLHCVIWDRTILHT